MARFVILKGGASYKIFEFEGSIARVGTGEMMDLQLEAPGFDGDLFFLTKTPRGYEIERRADQLAYTVNGASASGRQVLNDGDKVTFLDYIMIATYGTAPAAKVEAPAPAEKSAPPRVTAPVNVAPAVESPAPPPAPSPPPPQSPRAGGERPTMIIDSQAMTPPPAPASPPAGRREAGTQPLAKSRNPEAPARTPSPTKERITPVYSLVGLSGQYKGQVREINTREFVVGRDGSVCDLVIDRTEGGELDKSVSREHFVISSTEDGLYITDKKSRLRTFINGKILEPNQREFIAPEDIISIPVPTGEVKLRLCFLGQENFAADQGKSKYTPLIIGMVLVIVALIVTIIWLLGD
jgi:hypothetical protein